MEEAIVFNFTTFGHDSPVLLLHVNFLARGICIMNPGIGYCLDIKLE